MKQLKINNRITARDSYSISSYLKEISKYALLEPKEEVELAQRIRNGDTQAIHTLIMSNLRFVVSVAKQYQNQGLSLNDLINEGNIGLIKAASKFDETKGFKFISYAVWWIRQSILQALTQQAKMIKIPMNKVIEQNKLNTAINDFLQRHERKPTTEELAELLDMTTGEIAAIKSSMCEYISTDQPINGEEDTAFIDLMHDNSVPKPDAHLDKRSEEVYFNQILKELTDKEQQILKYYYGLNELNQRYNFEEIAEKMELTRERVRQIKNRAIKKISKGEATKRFKSL